MRAFSGIGASRRANGDGCRDFATRGRRPRDQTVGIDRDPENADLVAEVAREIETDGDAEVVQLLDRDELACRVVSDKKRSR